MNIKSSNFDKLFSANQNAMDVFFRTQLHSCDELSKLQSEFANLWLECLNAQMQRISSARNLNDICATEAGLTTEYSMKFSDNLRKAYETLLNAQKEYMKCLSASETEFSQESPVKPEKPAKGKAPV